MYFVRAGIAQSVQRLATGWKVRGSNRVGGEIFRTRPDQPWGPSSLLYNGYRVFPGGKAAGAWRWPPTPPSSAEVKERVQLYLYSPSGPSWPVLGRTLLYFTLLCFALLYFTNFMYFINFIKCFLHEIISSKPNRDRQRT